MGGTVRGMARTSLGKLAPPQVGGHLVERPRLLSALNAGTGAAGTFMMLSAPAGYGKTVLLGQWATENSAAGILTSWATLTTDDRDARVLWATIIDSLIVASEEHDAVLGLANALADLLPSTSPREHSEFLAEFTEALREYADPVVMIFDDAQTLEGSESEVEFVRLLQVLPGNVSVAFATRSPLHAHRTRVSGRLVELTADALSFTTAETSAFFADRDLPGDRVSALHDASDGWPAALSLALLSVERLGDPQTAPIDLVNPQVMHDYLQEEVYRDLTQRERNVLLAAAVSPVTTADLVAASINEADSGAILRELAQRNRMLHRTSTDDRGRIWYGVQPLFGAFLRERLAEGGPERLVEITRRAAEWQADNGDPVTALRLAISPPNPSLADRILRRYGYDMVGDARAQALLAHLASTDAAIDRPFARLMLAYAASLQGNAVRAREMLAPLDLLDLGADDLIEWDWLHYLVQMFLSLAERRPVADLSPGWPESTLQTVPSGLRLAVRMVRGFVKNQRGEIGPARADLAMALSIAEARDDLRHRIMSTVGLAGVAAAEFDVHRTRALCEDALGLADQLPADDLSATKAIAEALASWASMELLEPGAATCHAASAVAHSVKQPDPHLVALVGHLNDAALFAVAPQRRRIAQDFVTAWPPPYLERAATSSVLVSLHVGLTMAADLNGHRWSERLLDRARQRLGESYDWQVAYCRFLSFVGKESAIPLVLTPLLADDHSPRVALSEIVAWTLEAVLQGEANNSFRSHAALYRALQRADETGGYLEVASLGLRRVEPFLAAGLDRFGEHGHVARVLLASAVGDNALSSGALTEREAQVLEELRTLRTVEEIAHDILLSANTVKTHMRNIYRKLEVTSRRQAVARAEELGLL